MKAIAEGISASASTLSPAGAPLEISIDDRRRYIARIPIELKLRLTAVNYSGPARSVDLSVTGLLIETCVPLVLGERVILTIVHPDEQTSFNVCSEVVRASTDHDPSAPSRYGLRILTDDSLTWQNFLRLLVLK